MNINDIQNLKGPALNKLKGFRDFLPTEKRKRDYVASKIAAVFERYGFAPLETPTLEYASLLLGKYGDEADKLVYSFEDRGGRKVALRYDQTVPTARVLAQYHHELPKYFRRYQIQNVFRADKPQRGRFREFTQCDCDVYGATSTLADAEILAVYYAVYKELGITSIQIEINDRQTLLQTLTPFATKDCSVLSIIQTIDKLDKQSEAEVIDELMSKGLNESSATQALSSIKTAQPSENLSQIIEVAKSLGVPAKALTLNPTLARGLDYYTGLIFEGKIPEYTVGSVGGGGRYDNLINDLAGVQIPAVGFGIGFDRTVEAADQLGLIPTDNMGTQVLVTIFHESTVPDSAHIAQQLRDAGICVELYPHTTDSFGKQFQNAEDKNIPFAVIVGEDEIKDNVITVKNIKTREQQRMSVGEFVHSQDLEARP